MCIISPKPFTLKQKGTTGPVLLGLTGYRTPFPSHLLHFPDGCGASHSKLNSHLLLSPRSLLVWPHPVPLWVTEAPFIQSNWSGYSICSSPEGPSCLLQMPHHFYLQPQHLPECQDLTHSSHTRLVSPPHCLKPSRTSHFKPALIAPTESIHPSHTWCVPEYLCHPTPSLSQP